MDWDYRVMQTLVTGEGPQGPTAMTPMLVREVEGREGEEGGHDFETLVGFGPLGRDGSGL